MRRMWPKDLKVGQEFESLSGDEWVKVKEVTKNFVHVLFKNKVCPAGTVIVFEKDDFCSFLYNVGFVLKEKIPVQPLNVTAAEVDEKGMEG